MNVDEGREARTILDAKNIERAQCGFQEHRWGLRVRVRKPFSACVSISRDLWYKKLLSEEHTRMRLHILLVLLDSKGHKRLHILGVLSDSKEI
jgi:hypothetical protein